MAKKIRGRDVLPMLTTRKEDRHTTNVFGPGGDLVGVIEAEGYGNGVYVSIFHRTLTHGPRIVAVYPSEAMSDAMHIVADITANLWEPPVALKAGKGKVAVGDRVIYTRNFIRSLGMPASNDPLYHARMGAEVLAIGHNRVAYLLDSNLELRRVLITNLQATKAHPMRRNPGRYRPNDPANRCASCEAKDPRTYAQRQDVTILEDGNRFCMVCEREWTPGPPTRRRRSKPTLKRGDTVQISANKYFDRFGNTYHVVDVGVLPKGGKRWVHVGRSDMTYGYGSQYEQTAMEMLKQKFFMPRGWSRVARGRPAEHIPPWKFREFGIKVISQARDVKREKDLYKF